VARDELRVATIDAEMVVSDRAPGQPPPQRRSVERKELT
jgi:hypothetical protein